MSQLLQSTWRALSELNPPLTETDLDNAIRQTLLNVVMCRWYIGKEYEVNPEHVEEVTFRMELPFYSDVDEPLKWALANLKGFEYHLHILEAYRDSLGKPE